MMRMVSPVCSVNTTTMTPRATGPMAMKRSSAAECASSKISRLRETDEDDREIVGEVARAQAGVVGETPAVEGVGARDRGRPRSTVHVLVEAVGADDESATVDGTLERNRNGGAAAEERLAVLPSGERHHGSIGPQHLGLAVADTRL
jgi:hypothetical protein